jgi:hypothetical protein
MFNIFKKTNKKEFLNLIENKNSKEKDFTEELSYEDLKSENEALKGLIKCSFHLEMNLNDTFYYACADSESIDSDDILDMVSIAQKYTPFKAMTAYCSIKREKLYNEKDCSPIAYCKYPEDMKLFKAARKEIERELKGGEKFCDLSFEIDYLEKETKEFGEKILWTSSKQPNGLILQVASLKEQQIYGVGSNRKGAMDDLKNKLKEKNNESL